jgi:hypothetical protein
MIMVVVMVVVIIIILIIIRKYLSNIPGIHQVKELQKSTNVKCNRFNTGANDVCTINRNNRMAGTLFPRDIVCLRNISINTLHKGDDDDDDNTETCL